MKNTKYSTERILLIVALFLFAGLLFFNAFYREDACIPSIIYINENEKDSSSNNPETTSLEDKVNLNTATESELSENLSGIGDAIAKRIVEYREQSGGFASIEELKNVSGIGEKMFQKIKNNICV